MSTVNWNSDAMKTANHFLNQTYQMESTFSERVNQLISANLKNPAFDVRTLAASLYISRIQLFRKLKEETGKSPTTYIREYRLERGKELLETTDLLINQIAYEVGFKDPAHFSKAFKEWEGRSPKDVRK